MGGSRQQEVKSRIMTGGQISEYSKYFSYVATIGFIELNNANKSITY